MSWLRVPRVDVHTHVYLPRYAASLRSRTSVPRILSRSAPGGRTEERLLILEGEPSGGRPVGPQYWDRDEKLLFMDTHGIDVSIISSANPWLDFFLPQEAAMMAEALNDDLELYCSGSPSLVTKKSTLKRLYGFGLLPLVPNITISSLLESVKQISILPHLKGIIMGTQGIGLGLDDDALDPVWAAIGGAGLDNGHVLPLALGFPFETTTAATRMILGGVFDRFPSLRILLAHSGGALPQLSSRLASCIAHDPIIASRLKHDARYYLGKLWFDAVAYGSEELGFVSDVISRASGTGGPNRKLGSGRLLFGTDHPFFPPLTEIGKWRSVSDNLEAIDGVDSWGEAEKDGVRGGNALSLFNLL